MQAFLLCAVYSGPIKKRRNKTMKCKCKYYLMNKDGVRVCSVCGEPAPSKIEDKMQERHEDKAPLYISKKDRAKQEA